MMGLGFREVKNYAIAYSENLQTYLLYTTGKSVRYYTITEEEYSYSESAEKIQVLDRIALACDAMGTTNPRFLCSKKKTENKTDKQAENLKQIRKELNAGIDSAFEF